MSKASVTFAGEVLSAVSPVVWKFQTGTQPYTAVFQVHKSQWSKLESQIGSDDSNLVVIDARGVRTDIKNLTILHRVASDSPNRVSFLVADRRWKWPYKLVAKDFNVSKKTGDVSVGQALPIENLVTYDEYDFRKYSINGAVHWTAKDAVKDVLKTITENRFVIESFPIEKDGEAGQFSLQNVVLRDSGDVALGRLLSYIPGAEVYIDKDGKARVIDAAALEDAEDFYRNLPPSTWAGDSAAMIDRSKIRPKRVVVHYQREVEMLASFSDDYGPTSTGTKTKTQPFLDNVLPTVDPSTTLRSWNPISGSYSTWSVAQGTWVEVQQWLDAMDEDRPSGAAPWTFDTLKYTWMNGDEMERQLGALGLDSDPGGNVAQRAQVLREHWRSTFRVNPAMNDRIRDYLDVRVATLDPVTGARAPACVWNQVCIVPTEKGIRLMASRANPAQSGAMRNVDSLALSDAGARIGSTNAGPGDVQFRDKDLGIFTINLLHHPSGSDSDIMPFFCVGESGQGTPKVPVRDLGKQDTEMIAPGLRVESATNAPLVDATMRLKAMFTIIPAAPNNSRQFHQEIVTADDIAELYRGEYGIRGGSGPDLEVFVSPGECTARFQWSDDAAATDTIGRLLGLDSDDPNEAGIDGDVLPGFVMVNRDREIKGHARAVAAEALSAFANNIQGRVSTIVPGSGLKLKGNMSGASIVVGAAPSAKVSAVHEFPGQARAISRFATLPESNRLWTLGIVTYKASR